MNKKNEIDIWNIEERFDFLIKDYHLSYKFQVFHPFGNWTMHTHSFYNDSGCFTIYYEVGRDMFFFYSSKFSTELEQLREKGIDVSLLEPEIWKKNERIFIFKNPFFWVMNNKVLNTLSEALKVHLAKNNDFFGIQV